MCRWWKRLVISVSVVAFIVANTHASLAIAAYVGPACSHCHDCDATDDDADHDHCPGDSSCPGPDCPKTPSTPKCPCPGGCALCSVAKVPCLVAAPLPAGAASDLGDCITDGAPLYTAPFAGRLTRPPRA